MSKSSARVLNLGEPCTPGLPPPPPWLSRVGAKPALDASGCAERGSQAPSRRLKRRYPTWLPVARDPPAGPVGRSKLSSSPSSFSSLFIFLPPQTSDWRSLIGEAKNTPTIPISVVGDLCFDACFSQLEPKPPSGGHDDDDLGSIRPTPQSRFSALA